MHMNPTREKRRDDSAFSDSDTIRARSCYHRDSKRVKSISSKRREQQLFRQKQRDILTSLLED
jgi:hypothetical protein